MSIQRSLSQETATLIWNQEEDNPTLHIVTAFLLYDGRSSQDDELFSMMHSEGTFARLVELVQMKTVQEETRLHQMLLELLYESSRIQRLSWEDFSMFVIRPPDLGRSHAISHADESCVQWQ